MTLTTAVCEVRATLQDPVGPNYKLCAERCANRTASAVEMGPCARTSRPPRRPMRQPARRIKSPSLELFVSCGETIRP